VVEDSRKAEQIRAQALARPETFGDLAKEHSKDVGSAAANGMIQPIRRNVGRKEVEDMVFKMKPGEISPVVRVGNLYAIFKCEGRMPPVQVNFEKVKQSLITMIQDSKMHRVSDDIFRNLRQQAKVTIVLNNPELSAQMPGVAAVIGQRQLTVRELAEVCIERHGDEVLEGTINHRLLEQACKRKNVAVTDKDLDAEIARAAGLMLPRKADGSADVEQFLKRVTDDQGVSMEVYRNDSVWPSVALKKLVGSKVEISSEDMKKGFEANYGQRVRCRAIVLGNLRQAQKVWEEARKKPDEDTFGDLAAKYSIEASSRSLRGEIPPIQMHSGQPVLEKEAFALKEGELSSIIQVGPEQYVLLFCVGRTKPVEVKYDEVKQYIYEDIHEKKLRLAMADYFQNLQDNATIDNYMAGSSQSPKKAQPPAGTMGAVPTRPRDPVR
jgi:parvulin-like peptidyl-prolyl isomerase